MFTAVVPQLAGEQALDDVDRLREALLPRADAWPTGADDVLVQALAGPKPQHETIVAEQRERGRSLSHDGRMIACRGTGDRGHQSDPLRRISDRAEDRPGQRRMSLLFHPRGEVIRNGHEVETDFLSAPGVVHERRRTVL